MHLLVKISKFGGLDLRAKLKKIFVTDESTFSYGDHYLETAEHRLC